MRSEMISKVGLGFVVSILMFSSLVFAQGLEGVIGTLKEIGVFQFYLPFLIAFAVLYALLLKVKIFGDNKGLVTVIALVAAAFVIVYIPVGLTFSQFLTNLFGNAVVVILTIVVLLIFVNMFQSEGVNILPKDFKEIIKGSTLWILLLLIALIAFGVFVASGGTSIFPGLKIFPKETFSAIGGLSTTTWAIIILIVGTGLIVFLFSRGGGTPKGPGQ